MRWAIVGFVLFGAMVVAGAVSAQEPGSDQVDLPSSWPATVTATAQAFDHPVTSHWLAQVEAHEAQARTPGWLSFERYTIEAGRDLLATPTFAQMVASDRVGSQLLVRLVDGSDPTDIESAGVIHDEQLAAGLIPGLHRYSVDGDTDFATALEQINAHPAVLYAEPGYRLDQTAVPNDPGAGGGLGSAWWLDQINAFEAWDVATDATAIGPIMVFDQGILGTHPDLVDNLWTNPDDGGYGLRITPTLSTHGTPVAGTICGQGDNGIGYAGSAWDCELMEVRAPLTFSATPADFATAIDYAVGYGSRLSNHSWRVFNYSQVIADTVAAAGDADHLVVAAAGNESDNIPSGGSAYPAQLPDDNVLTIAASTRSESRISYSNWGPVAVDLAAPTEFVVPSWQGGYAGFSGTSQSTPVVVGAVALAWAQNPDLSAVEIKQLVLDTARPVTAWSGLTVTGGILDMEALMAAVPVFVVEPIADQYSEVGQSVSLQVVASNPGASLAYSAQGLPDGLGIDGSSGLISGTTTTEQDSEVTVTVTAAGEQKTVVFQWNVAVNDPPSVVNPGFQAGPRGPVSLQILASDPDGQPLAFEASGLPQGLTIAPDTGLISGATTTAETTTVTVTATDPIGASESISFDWVVIGPTVIDDFETDQGWQVDPDGTDTATTGLWAVANPQASPLLDGANYQLDVTPSGSQALVTGPLAGTSVGTHDIDSGTTTVRSPAIDVPAEALSIEFQYYLATYSNSSSDDFFRVVVNDEAGQPTEVFARAGSSAVEPAAYQLATFDVTPWAGQRITIEFSASDSAGASLVEAAVDDLAIVIGLPQQASLGGTVTTTIGDPAGLIEVDLFSAAPDGSRDSFLQSTATAGDGTYSFEVDPGDYVVTFVAPEGREFTNNSRWFNRSATVAPGETVAGIDATLIADDDPAAASVGGTVTTTTGDPVGLVEIDLFAANPDGSRGSFLDSTATAADGSYDFDVEAGVYVVTLIAPDGEEFTNGSRWLNQLVSVDPGETIDDVDGVIVAGDDPDQASVGGTVTTTAGAPVAAIDVDLFTAAPDGSRDTWTDSTTTADDGTYDFDVEPGDYVITFIAPEGEEFTNGSRWLNQLVSVGPGETIDGIDASIVADGGPGPGASISGQVTFDDGAPVHLRVVERYTALADGTRGDFLDAKATDTNGQYSFAVDPGAYVLTFVGRDGEQWVDSGSTFLNVPVVVAAGEDLTGIDAVLIPAP